MNAATTRWWLRFFMAAVGFVESAENRGTLFGTVQRRFNGVCTLRLWSSRTITLVFVVRRSGTLHAVSQLDDESGGRTAVTIQNRPGKDVLVWARLLMPSALAKSAAEIEPGDYVRRQIVSFSCWPDVCAHYGGYPQFAPLFEHLQEVVEQRISSGENVPGPQFA